MINILSNFKRRILLARTICKSQLKSKNQLLITNGINNIHFNVEKYSPMIIMFLVRFFFCYYYFTSTVCKDLT